MILARQPGSRGARGTRSKALIWFFSVASVLSAALFFSPPSAGQSPVERALQQAVGRAPESFEANHRLGEFYLRAGRAREAIPLLEKARRADPAHYPNNHDLALAYSQTGDHAAARAQAQRLLAEKPTAESHHLLGQVEEHAGNLVAAAEAYQRAAQLEPDEQNTFDLGNSLLRLNAPQEALQIFAYAVQKHPGSARLRVGQGIAEYALGRYDLAVESLCRAVDLDQRDPRPYVFLGEMYGVSAELADEISRRFEAFLRLHPENALAHYYYAMNLWKGKHRAAPEAELGRIEALLKDAVRLDPQLSDGFFQLGALYSDQQKYREAIPLLRRAADLKPDDEKAHYRLAQAYQRTGQAALAAKEFELVKQIKAR